MVVMLLLLLLGAARALDCNDPYAWPDIATTPPDLVVPPMLDHTPSPGLRVRQVLPAWQHTTVHHSVYLPTDWAPNSSRPFPVIVDFAGNGPFHDSLGDVCTGQVRNQSFGYGISGGERFIWVSAPYLTADGTANQIKWWGGAALGKPGPDYSVEPTVAYTKALVPAVLEQFRGDPSRVLLSGFSRGALATGYIGLHDPEIASLWAGFIPYGHYDGRPSDAQWPYPNCSGADARARLSRIGARPSFVSEKMCGVNETRAYIEGSGVAREGSFSFVSTGFRNHNDQWVLRPSAARERLRAWLVTHGFV